MTVRAAPWIPSTAGITVPGEIVRLAMASLVPSPGIANTTDLTVAAHGTPNMTVDVAAGGVWIKGTSVGTQGSYFLYNDASLSVPIAAADPSNPRIDLIVAVIRDNAEDASGSTDARIIAVTGTPAGSPVAPSAPASSIILAQIAVAATTTTIVSGNITDKRGATCGDGFVVCTSGTRPTARQGLGVFETDTGAISLYSGSAWVSVATLGTALTGARVAYTPTVASVSGTSSISAQAGRWKQVAKDLSGTATFTATFSGAGASCTVTLPNSLTAASAQAVAVSDALHIATLAAWVPSGSNLCTIWCFSASGIAASNVIVSFPQLEVS